MILSNAAIKNRVTVLVLVIIIVVAGVYSYATLPRESSPDVPIPLILITTGYEGVAPQDVESSVTMKIEKKLTGLSGVKEIRSSSAEGLSVISVEFLPDVKIDDALQRVKDKVDQAKGDLPNTEDLADPVVTEINIAEFPILQISLSGDLDLVRLKAIADELEDAIEAQPGVLDCEVSGGLEREIRLEVDPDRLAAYGLRLPELMQLVPSENVNISAGGLETPGTKFNVRMGAEFVDPGEVDHLLLTVREDNKPIYLSDVAEVSDTFKDRMTYARLNGKNTITLSVKKRVGANIIEIVERVEMVIEQARKAVPRGVKFEFTMDQSKDIKAMIADLENNMFAAFVLVLAVLLIFMGWRSSVIVAMAIPLSMLMSFTILQMMGYTLNMIVLFSLVLALGMLVDNAIVIVENVYRHRQLGYSPIEAARLGAAEVAWPVITSTITTVVAFLPMMFWPGIMGDFMKYLPITVSIVLLCSLFVALVISPVMCTLFTGAPRPRDSENPILHAYRKVLAFTLNRRAATMIFTLLLLLAMGVIYVKRDTGMEFFPSIDPRQAAINIRGPQGINIRRTDEIARDVERRVEANRADLEYVVSNVGGGGGPEAALFGGASGLHAGSVAMIFKDFDQRERPSAEAIVEVRSRMTDLHGAEVTVEKQEEGPPTGAAVTVQIMGPDFKTLQRLSEQCRRAIADVPNLVNLRSDLEAARPEIPFTPDRRRAMLLGVNTVVVGNFLKTCVFGTKVGTYRQFNDEYDITVRLPERDRSSLDRLENLRVPNAAGQSVPLSSLGEFGYKGGFGTIYRINQKRAVTLTGDAEGRLDTEVLKDVQNRLAKVELPPGYQVRYAGQKEEEDNAKAFLGRALVIALLLITLTLVCQFNTLTVPLIIMTTVPLSMIGVLVGLVVADLPWSIIMTGIGVISLAGVVVNNAIVLLDYMRILRARGMDLVAAAVEAGVTRLRPVMLTAGTTVIGLIPTALGQSFDVHTFEWVARSESSQWWRNMAISLIFGLCFATLLTLVFVPTLYVAIYKLIGRFRNEPATGPDAPADPKVQNH